MKKEDEEQVIKFSEDQVQSAKAIIVAGSELTPLGWLCIKHLSSGEYGKIVIPHIYRFFQKGSSKAQIPQYIQRCYDVAIGLGELTQNLFELSAVVLISDAYMITRPLEHLHDKAFDIPSKQPDRQEAILLDIQFNDKKFAYFYPYDRVNGQIVFQPERVGGDNTEAKDPRFNFNRLYPNTI